MEKLQEGGDIRVNKKNFFLAEYKKSPAAYRSRQKMFKLPCQATLKTQLKTLKLNTGINPCIKSWLIYARSKMTDERDAVCTLIWDEHSCSTHLDYDQEIDRISGFVSWNGTTSNDIVDHGLTFMLRSLHGNWIIPVAFGLCDGTTDKNDLQQQIKDVVKLAEECNFQIVPSTCDQGSSNRGAINILLTETKALLARKGLEHREYQPLRGHTHQKF